MITEAIFRFFRLILDGLNFLLPDWNPLGLDGMVASITAGGPGGTLFGMLRWANYYAPVSEALTIGLLALTLWMAALLYKVAMKLGRTLHLFGGSS